MTHSSFSLILTGFGVSSQPLDSHVTSLGCCVQWLDELWPVWPQPLLVTRLGERRASLGLRLQCEGSSGFHSLISPQIHSLLPSLSLPPSPWLCFVCCKESTDVYALLQDQLGLIRELLHGVRSFVIFLCCSTMPPTHDVLWSTWLTTAGFLLVRVCHFITTGKPEIARWRQRLFESSDRFWIETEVLWVLLLPCNLWVVILDWNITKHLGIQPF